MNSKDWILTDSDCMQYGKRIDITTYNYIEMLEVGDFDVPTYRVCRAKIDLLDYDNDEINDFIRPYDYTIDFLEKEYERDDRNRIVAECIFESLRACDCDFAKEFTNQKDAAKYIQQYIGNN